MYGDDDAPVQTESERVEAWRADQLIRAGYPNTIALELAARTDVDIRQAEQLLEQGCGVELAARILA